jgi:hypothetical protein
VNLAVYRTTAGGWYFVAPAGLMAHDALGQRVSGLFADQIVALGALIELQHDHAT